MKTSMFQFFCHCITADLLYIKRDSRFRGSGFKVQGFRGSGFKVQGFRVQGFKVQGFRVQGSEFRALGSEVQEVQLHGIG